MTVFIKLLLLILLLWWNQSFCQTSYYFNDSIKARKDIIDIVFQDKRDSLLVKKNKKGKKMYFSLMPVSSSGSDVAFSAISTSFYLGNPKTTNLSNVTFYPTTNFTSYIQFKTFPNLWLSNNSWNITGKMEIAQEQLNKYDLGGNSPSENPDIISFKLSRTYITVNRLLIKYFFFGIGYSIDYFYDVTSLSPASVSSDINHERIVSSGITFNLLRDNRKNSLNPIGGFYTNLSLRLNDDWAGSDYKWGSIYFDARKYINFSKTRHRTLALWGLYWATWGDVPYLNIPGNGLDYSNWTGRGYKKARYRGKQMLYSELEYRFDITRNGLLGAVFFTNIQSYLEPEINKFAYIIPAVGSGLRLKFNKYSDSNITIDCALGRESFHWYFSLNEVF